MVEFVIFFVENIWFEDVASIELGVRFSSITEFWVFILGWISVISLGDLVSIVVWIGISVCIGVEIRLSNFSGDGVSRWGWITVGSLDDTDCVGISILFSVIPRDGLWGWGWITVDSL